MPGAAERPLTRPRIIAVAAVTGLIGFAVGAFVVPTWQDVIEPAQVLASVVRYPTDNPVYLYSTRTWTLLHQVPALLLRAGASERTIAVLLSGLSGLVSFQALGLTILALSGDVALACVMPFFVFVTHAASGGMAYPVVPVGSIYTSGVIGLSWLLLVVALLGAGAFAPGVFLLGLMPAVHATLAAWGFVVIGLTAALSDTAVREPLWRARYWFAEGVAISVASALIHFSLFAPPSTITSDEVTKYLAASMTYWDDHRRVFARLSIEAAPLVISVSFLSVWSRRFRSTLPAASWLLIRALLVAAAVGFIGSVVLAMDTGILRGWLWRALPSRLMNLPILACAATIVGIAGRCREDLRIQFVLAAVTVLLSVVALIDSNVSGHVSYFVMLGAVIALIKIAGDTDGDTPSRQTSSQKLRLLRFVVLGVPLALLAGTAWQASTRFVARLHGFDDPTTDRLWATASARSGLLLTASNLHLIQLRTRRAVLLDGGALDALAYVPDAAPSTERILRDVYGINLLAPGLPPRSARGYLSTDAAKDLWQQRTTDEWRNVAREFGVTDVLTFENWRLHLPEVTRWNGLVLYSIPQ